MFAILSNLEIFRNIVINYYHAGIQEKLEGFLPKGNYEKPFGISSRGTLLSSGFSRYPFNER